MIKGQIELPPMTAQGIHKADLRLYKSSDTADMFVNEGLGDWDTVQSKVDMSGDNVHDLLLALKSQDYKTNEDGTYEIYVIPGTYDLLIDAPSYLDCIYVDKTLAEGDELDLGVHSMFAGDVDKSGLIEIQDISIIGNVYGAIDGDYNYDIGYDFNEDEVIDIIEISCIGNNYLKSREVIR